MAYGDNRSKVISLWCCLTVDLITDLMSKIPCFLPSALYQASKPGFTKTEKLSVGAVFIVGIIAMTCATIRVVSLNKSKDTNGAQLSTTWLILWAGIKGVVGMLNSFPMHITLGSQRAFLTFTDAIL